MDRITDTLIDHENLCPAGWKEKRSGKRKRNMNRIINILLLLVLSGIIYGCVKKDAGIREDFNSDWQFCRSSDTALSPSLSAIWERVDLPHTANIEPLVVTDQWQGICFYRKEFTPGKELKGKLLSLQFDGAMNIAEVWVNGKKIIRHYGGYLPFVADLDGVIRFDTLNTIVVRLDNRDNPVTGPKPLRILDFNMYGGIYRNVYLIAKEKVHLSNPLQANVVAGGGVFFAVTEADSGEASFEIRSHIQNHDSVPAVINVRHTLADRAGRVVASLQSPDKAIAAGEAAEVKIVGSIGNPLLWSPATPDLYELVTEVYSNGRLTDKQTDRVGIRTIHITPEGLWLNGERTFLRGVNRHQEYPYVGYALSDAAQYRDAYKIKQAGFDLVRCSHYPMSPAFLDACDELGIMVLDAILGWQYYGDEAFERLALRSSRELIRRDRNHPSVLAWELSVNETYMPPSFTDSAQIIAHEEYPYSGCYSAGWMLQPYDIYIEARQHRHGLYPDKPLLVSEYGDWEYYAQNAGFNQEEWNNLLDAERNSRQPRYAGEKRMLQQALNIQEAHNDNLSTHAFADCYWVMFDYNRGMSPDLEYSGIMDIFRLPKYSYYFFSSQRSPSSVDLFAGPVVSIASYWTPGESNMVRVFSNCEEVELFVDGLSAGRKKKDINSFTTNLHHPPFTFQVSCDRPGTLLAKGYIGDISVASDSVTTPSESSKIILKVDRSGRDPERNDLLFIYAMICDDDNNIVHDDSRVVSFDIEGAEIKGPAEMEAQAGIATVLMRTPLDASRITVIAGAEGLKSDTTYIQTK